MYKLYLSNDGDFNSIPIQSKPSIYVINYIYRTPSPPLSSPPLPSPPIYTHLRYLTIYLPLYLISMPLNPQPQFPVPSPQSPNLNPQIQTSILRLFPPFSSSFSFFFPPFFSFRLLGVGRRGGFVALLSTLRFGWCWVELGWVE